MTGQTGSIAVLAWIRLFSGAALTIILVTSTFAATTSHLSARPTPPPSATQRTGSRLAGPAASIALPLTLAVLAGAGVAAILGRILTEIGT